ncbi:MAG: energy-coupling factor ABC transporter ATP-binding protein [Oscillospiraceae bacterium]|nr:energy-coupling factor ABC transporter ATP-binding protein [Oscillospiraceae bacterium]
MRITLEDVVFAYQNGGFEVSVDALTLGFCTVVLGDNGSGKTTLGKLCAGILRPDKGAVYYDGADIAQWSLGKIGRSVGYLFQEPSRQLFAQTPLEEIAFPLEIRGESKKNAEKKARELLAEFELSDIADSNAYTLSRGEKQRLAIAAAMAVSPNFFILDEPTTGLDEPRKSILLSALNNLKTKGVGLLVITHDRGFARRLDAQTLTMGGGRVLA